MATFTVPSAYRDEVAVAMREYLGDDAEGLTDAVVLTKAVRRFIKRAVNQVARRGATSQAVTDAETMLTARDAAVQRAVQARKDAEDAEDASVEAAFGSDS